jgi:CheY-like chemotaxis protein
MSKTLLIVESDPGVVDGIRAQLERRGCTLEQTQDGKGCVDLVRRQRPAAVILAVELPAGQNGYLVCREIKKDDDLKTTPVVIIGNPEKFADHRKLRTRADAYVAKPVDLSELMRELDTLVGGFPAEAQEEASSDETVSLTDLLDEPGESAEEIAVEGDGAEDSDLALLDSALGEGGGEEPVVIDDVDVSEASVDEAPPSEMLTESDNTDDVLSALDGPSDVPEPLADEPPTAIDAPEEPPLSEEESPALSAEEPAPPPPVPLRTGASADVAELRSLRARTAELEDQLERAQSRASEAEERVGVVESELAQKSGELEASRSGAGKTDKDYFALREAANKKDKDILKLKNELNEKEQAELELREREVQLEQKLAEQTAEMGRKDAQLKALTTRADALLGEKKRAESQEKSAREEARAATERAQTAADRARETAEQLQTTESQLGNERSAHLRAEEELAALRAETSESRGKIEGLERELEEARTQLMEQTTAFAEEGAGLRARVAELEGQVAKHEERITKLYARIKGEEKLRDRVKKALGIASQLLDEPSAQVSEDDGSPAGDEPRAA